MHRAVPGEDALWVFGDVADDDWAGQGPPRDRRGVSPALAPLHPIEPTRGEAETYPVGL